MEIYGVIGDPIWHSLSPQIHNFWFEKLGLDGIYLAFRVKPDQLHDFLKFCQRIGISGLNVTAPLKQRILEFVTPTPEVVEIGALNTLDGELRGYNTDAIAAEKLVSQILDISRARVLILGAGGAARALAYALRSAARMIIANRTWERGLELAGKYNAELIRLDQIPQVLPEVDLVVNATPLGRNPGESPIDPKLLTSKIAVMDLVYPHTELIKAARALGSPSIDGIQMLVAQAAESFKIWTGISIQEDLIQETIRRLNLGWI